MARARTVRPEFFSNELLAECSMAARLAFVGLWTLADREGRLEDRPKRIGALLFPYDRDIDVNKLLDELQSRGFIQRYDAGGIRVVSVTSFVKHQHPHPKEPPSTLPEKPENPQQNQGAAEDHGEPWRSTVNPALPSGSSGSSGPSGSSESDQETLSPEDSTVAPDAERQASAQIALIAPRSALGKFRRVPADWVPKQEHVVLARALGLNAFGWQWAQDQFRDIDFPKPRVDADRCFNRFLRDSAARILQLQRARRQEQPGGIASSRLSRDERTQAAFAEVEALDRLAEEGNPDALRG